MATLEKLKSYLRIDINDEDALLQDFLTTARAYLTGAVTNFDENYTASEEFAAKADFLMLVLAAEYYQNRSNDDHNLSYTIRSLITQLQYFVGGEN